MAAAKRKETLRTSNYTISSPLLLQKTKISPEKQLLRSPRHKIVGANTPLTRPPANTRSPTRPPVITRSHDSPRLPLLATSPPRKKRKFDETNLMKKIDSIIDDDLYNEEDSDNGSTQMISSLSPSPLNKRMNKSLTTNASHRGVTLRMLLDEGILDTGKSCLTIDYLGRKFIGDLLSSGKIRWIETNEIFNSPSAWAIHCKKVVNPKMKSGCGWASVKYHGTKLDYYKTTWLQYQHSGFQLSSLDVINDFDSDCSSSDKQDLSTTTTSSRHTVSDVSSQICNDLSNNGQLCTDSPSIHKTNSVGTSPHSKCGLESLKSPVRYNELSSKVEELDLSKQVECLQFHELSKMQPFTLSVSSSAFLVMDFHSHLSCKEVVGYLAGHWDSTKQHLSVSRAYPCRCQLNDWQQSFVIEDQIRSEMKRHKLQLVGWYHSHPNTYTQPTLYDIDCQMYYQRTLKHTDGSTIPSFAIITSTYQKQKKGVLDECRKAYMVLSPPDVRSGDYGIPMELHHDLHHEEHITQDILNEISLAVQYYEKISEFITFTTDKQDNSQSNLLQVMNCLKRNIPKEDTDGWLLNSITRLLTKI